MSSQSGVREVANRAKEAGRLLSVAGTAGKNSALDNMASLLDRFCDDVVRENNRDLNRAKENGTENALYERLRFDESKVRSRITSLKKIAALPDPIGQIFEQQKTHNGLMVGRMRVSLGVLLMIYEARPHVTVNAGAFAVKSGNAIICKGGSEAQNCNALLGRMWAESLELAGLPGDAIQVVSLEHREVDELLAMRDDIDLVIPRGGKDLIRSVAEKTRIPVIKHFEGVCHVYVGPQANMDKALQIALDSKLLMPAVCNAAETLLLDESLQKWLPYFLKTLEQKEIAICGCPLVCQHLKSARPATEEDWYAEYLDKTYAVRIVDGIDSAIEHIARYGSGHTDVIVTESYSDAQRFVREVDSSVVLVNASTMFCDGETLGMGAEIGISTGKYHARGPMGLNELTSYKHVILGEGQIMGPSYPIAKTIT